MNITPRHGADMYRPLPLAIMSSMASTILATLRSTATGIPSSETTSSETPTTPPTQILSLTFLSLNHLLSYTLTTFPRILSALFSPLLTPLFEHSKILPTRHTIK
jgi:hypothetical protein